MNKTITTLTALLLTSAPSLSEPLFKPFGVVLNGTNCQIKLAFPSADFCGTEIRPEEVLGWYSHAREDKGEGTFIYIPSGMQQVRIYDPGAWKRFQVEFQIWSGKAPIPTGSSNLHLGN